MQLLGLASQQCMLLLLIQSIFNLLRAAFGMDHFGYIIMSYCSLFKVKCCEDVAKYISQTKVTDSKVHGQFATYTCRFVKASIYLHILFISITLFMQYLCLVRTFMFPQIYLYIMLFLCMTFDLSKAYRIFIINLWMHLCLYIYL